MKNVARRTELVVAAGVAVFGLAFAFVGASWVAGSLGISASAASQVVDAISAGGLAFALVSALFSGGVLSAITATVMFKVKSLGKQAAAA